MNLHRVGAERSELAPERFGRSRAYALGKLSGRASVAHHLRQLGLSPEPAVLDAVLDAIVAWGDQKRAVAPADVLRLARAMAASPDTPTERERR